MVTLQRKQAIIEISYIIRVKYQHPSHDFFNDGTLFGC